MAERSRGERAPRRASGGRALRRGAASEAARGGARSEAGSPRVAVVMGSRSDWEAMRAASETLEELGIPHEVHVASAHRTPDRVRRLARAAEQRGLEVLIAGAGGAAHLAGALAAHTLLPVLGVPLASSPLGGLDALLSTVQMPAGVPVATLGIGTAGARNAAVLAASILARKDPALRERLAAWRRERAAAAAGPPPR